MSKFFKIDSTIKREYAPLIPALIGLIGQFCFLMGIVEAIQSPKISFARIVEGYAAVALQGLCIALGIPPSSISRKIAIIAGAIAPIFLAISWCFIDRFNSDDAIIIPKNDSINWSALSISIAGSATNLPFALGYLLLALKKLNLTEEPERKDYTATPN